LEMVRQLFKAGILQSAFWHQFSMTAHSPVGLEPEKYNVIRESIVEGSFANNDLVHDDPTGAEHELYSFGLKKSLFNFMHGIRLDDPVHKWFDFKTQKSSVDPDYIVNALNDDDDLSYKPNSKVVWLGKLSHHEHFVQSKKGNQREMISLHFDTRKQSLSLQFPKEQGEWLSNTLSQISIKNPKIYTLQELRESFEAKGFDDFELFWFNKPVSMMNKLGLLKL